MPGTAVFMTGDPHGTPPALLHNLKHNKVLHEQVVSAHHRSRRTCRTCRRDERVDGEGARQGFFRVVARYGFMEQRRRPGAARAAAGSGVPIDRDTTYFLGRETLIASGGSRDGMWREKLFAYHVAQRAQRDRLLPAAAEPRGGAGGAGRALSSHDYWIPSRSFATSCRLAVDVDVLAAREQVRKQRWTRLGLRRPWLPAH